MSVGEPISIAEAWDIVTRHESRGNERAIGDSGRAAGMGQEWWIFRKQWWPSWCWDLLAQLDYLAFRACMRATLKERSLREWYETVYNPNAVAPDLPSCSVRIES